MSVGIGKKVETQDAEEEMAEIGPVFGLEKWDIKTEEGINSRQQIYAPVTITFSGRWFDRRWV